MRRMLGASQSQTGDQSDDDDDSSEAELKIDEGEDAQNVVRFRLVQRISSSNLFSLSWGTLQFQGHWQPNGSGIYIHPANGASESI